MLENLIIIISTIAVCFIFAISRRAYYLFKTSDDVIRSNVENMLADKNKLVEIARKLKTYKDQK